MGQSSSSRATASGYASYPSTTKPGPLSTATAGAPGLPYGQAGGGEMGVPALQDLRIPVRMRDQGSASRVREPVDDRTDRGRDPDNLRPRGEQIGTVVAQCTVVTVGDDPEDPEDAPSVICSDVFTLEGRGDIAAADSFTFADPPEDVLPITGGTGKFRDAGGEIFLSSQQIEDTGLSNSIYTIRLLHLGD